MINLEGLLVVLLLGCFYVYVYRKIKSERLELFEKKKRTIKRSYDFDPRDVILHETLRHDSIDSYEVKRSAGRRKLRLLQKNIQKMSMYLNNDIQFSSFINSEHNSIEVQVNREQYYLLVKPQTFFRRKNVFAKSIKTRYVLVLKHRAVVLFEDEDVYLVFKMFIRSIVKEIGYKRLFKERKIIKGMTREDFLAQKALALYGKKIT